MAPTSKSKALSVSAGSFLELKAELAKKEEQLAKNKAAGRSTSIIGGVKRPDKTPTVWARQNKGVSSRAARDVELEAISKPTIESAYAALERKAKIYDKLRKGKSGGLSDKQYDSLLVDFDQKSGNVYESDSDDVDESLMVPQAPTDEQNDPIIEYEDEFGRVRTGRRSEIPRELLPREDKDQNDDEEESVIHNPVNHFPVYVPSAERVAAIEETFSEANNPLGVHYDATNEVRAKGAGFYQFSGDEETRRRQMEELKSARTETEKIRQETGATDVKIGEVEGMQEEGGSLKSRAMEKRKRELEERRRLLDAKRRKVNDTTDLTDESQHKVAQFASEPPIFAAMPIDPIAALETRTSTEKKGKDKLSLNPADAFLAQLEQDILGKK